MSRNATLVTLVIVVGIFAVISVPITLATLTAPTTNARSAFYSTSVYSPTALSGVWNGGSTTLNWTPPAGGGNGNGYLVSGMNNGASNACPATAASYSTSVGSTSGATFTDAASALLSAATWSYNCYLVQTGYNPAGAAPWASAPAWTNATSLATVAVQMTITHVQNKCVIGFGTVNNATFAGAVKAGDLLTAVTRGNPAETVTDNVNGAWTQVTNNGSVFLWYKQNSLAAAAGALTVKLTATNSQVRICADEFNGVATTNALDKFSNSASGASPWVAAATPAVAAAELVVAGIGTATNNVTANAGTSNGKAMTLGGRITNGTQGTQASEYLLSSAAGAQNSSMTLAPSTAASGVQGVFRPRGAAIAKALVQSGPDVIDAAAGSPTGTLPAASAAGNLLVAVVDNSSTTGATGPAGWVLAVSIAGGGGSGTEEIWYYKNNPGGISSATFTSAGPWAMVQLSEWSGFSTVAPLDQTGSIFDGTGNVSLTLTASAPTTAAAELVVTGYATANGVNTFTSGAGYSNLVNDPTNGILNDYKLGVASGTTASETVTADINTGDWAAAMATFK